MTVIVATSKNVLYYQCRVCEAPLFDEVSRAAGWCGCKSKQVVKTLPNLDDPYGQPLPLVASEAAQ